jgi:hypothetical protein
MLRLLTRDFQNIRLKCYHLRLLVPVSNPRPPEYTPQMLSIQGSWFQFPTRDLRNIRHKCYQFKAPGSSFQPETSGIYATNAIPSGTSLHSLTLTTRFKRTSNKTKASYHNTRGSARRLQAHLKFLNLSSKIIGYNFNYEATIFLLFERQKANGTKSINNLISFRGFFMITSEILEGSSTFLCRSVPVGSQAADRHRAL